MGTVFYKGVVLNGISWPERDGRPYRQGDSIIVTEEDARLLEQAGVVGGMKKFVREATVETAVKEAPENASRNYQRKRA
jgi:hypothetical protein